MDGKRIMAAAALALFAAAGGGLLLAHYARPDMPAAPEPTWRPGAGRQAPSSEPESGIVLAPEPVSGTYAAPVSRPESQPPAPPSRDERADAGYDPEPLVPSDLPDPEAEEAARDASAAFEDPQPPQPPQQ